MFVIKKSPPFRGGDFILPYGDLNMGYASNAHASYAGGFSV